MPDRDNPRIRQRIWINKLSKESQRVAKNNGRRPRITHRRRRRRRRRRTLDVISSQPSCQNENIETKSQVTDADDEIKAERKKRKKKKKKTIVEEKKVKCCI